MTETSHAATSETEPLRTELFIDGEWRPSGSRRRFDVTDPSGTGVIASVADADLDDAAEALTAAHEALPAWSETPPRQRAEALRRCFELMTEHSERLAVLISRENGKALKDARGEVAYAAEFFRWYSEEAVRMIGDVSLAPAGTNRILVQHQPIGVSVLITPWNFPAAMATRKLAPALAAGCTVVLKPASLTPLTALAVVDLMTQAGVPAGVVNTVTTTASGKTVSHLLADPRVRKLSFTGSTEVGKILLKQAADQVLNCSMELGGNAPVIVFEDADLDLALDAVMIAKMRNGGQACTAANRIYVQRGVHDTFAARLAGRMAKLKVGSGTDEATDCGPLVDEATRDRVIALVEDAVEKGAKLLIGGSIPDRPGYFYEPTVLTNVDPSSRIAHEEVFGPVAAIYSFDADADAIAAANDTEYGLASYVFTSNLARGLSVAERIEAGMVGLNRGLVSDPAAPFGGVKQSGLGREGAHDGLLEFTETKYIAASW